MSPYTGDSAMQVLVCNASCLDWTLKLLDSHKCLHKGKPDLHAEGHNLLTAEHNKLGLSWAKLNRAEAGSWGLLLRVKVDITNCR